MALCGKAVGVLPADGDGRLGRPSFMVRIGDQYGERVSILSAKGAPSGSVMDINPAFVDAQIGRC